MSDINEYRINTSNLLSIIENEIQNIFNSLEKLSNEFEFWFEYQSTEDKGLTGDELYGDDAKKLMKITIHSLNNDRGIMNMLKFLNKKNPEKAKEIAESSRNYYEKIVKLMICCSNFLKGHDIFENEVERCHKLINNYLEGYGLPPIPKEPYVGKSDPKNELKNLTERATKNLLKRNF